MPQFAMISGDVTFTSGDGVAGVAAIPISQFNDYVEGGKITWEAKE